MRGVTVFDEHAHEYDDWFDEHNRIYQAEVNALRRFIPTTGDGLEVGVGTGRFAIPFRIRLGVEPSQRMAEVARSRGISVVRAVGERLPFRENRFDFALLVTVICFVEDVQALLRETRRVIKTHGHVIIGFIDRFSPLGQLYESRKDTIKFYQSAHFYSIKEVANWAREVGFRNIQFCQTIFGAPSRTAEVDEVRDGYGDGAFVVLKAAKTEVRGEEE